MFLIFKKLSEALIRKATAFIFSSTFGPVSNMSTDFCQDLFVHHLYLSNELKTMSEALYLGQP